MFGNYFTICGARSLCLPLFARVAILSVMLPDKKRGDETLTGTVIRSGGGFYDVDVPEEDEIIVCAMAGLLKKGRRTHAQPVAVGDQVLVRPTQSDGENTRGQRVQEGYIEEVLPRRSALGRSRYGKTAQITLANLDLVVVALAVHEPNFNSHRLDLSLIHI